MEDLGAYVADVGARNADAIDRAAEAVVRTARAGGLVRPTGAGHSLAAVLETFFRAGGLAGVRPIWHPRVLPFSGARSATTAEREPGLGAATAAEAAIEARDTVVVFSNSGVNPFPVEVAQAAVAVGATVVAVTSRAAGAAAPPRAGQRLVDVADVVIDTAVPAGDATWPPEAPVTAPVSSLATTTVWTLLLRRVHDLAPDAPRWRSANVAGNDDVNAALVARFAAQVPEL
ncbi:sugar isomerase domain-containing protein [Cellulomonas triticagri]|uniref:Sugar isomerase domain-containing protein n=1 Tax=Cellulomonas triticagri TaxID=2483352 RepID=A0A3M2JJZ5_9CELL|nr:sugar isomerase domain-containing protein [Cellulomonas triticagri]RMI12526.1 sugar isomerase domain-containing protein [Cellulomonas triticagri]